MGTSRREHVQEFEGLADSGSGKVLNSDICGT